MTATVLALVIGLSPVPDSTQSQGQEPTVESLVQRLEAGRLVLEQARFKPSADELVDGVEPVLKQAARALSRTSGRFLVLVPAERTPGLPPDTVLSRRRANAAFRRLIAVGSNPERLLEPGQTGREPIPAPPVPLNEARIELVRVN